jgi:hypothetical protein
MNEQAESPQAARRQDAMDSENSPQTALSPPAQSHQDAAFRWNIESITATSITGWIMPTDAPARQCIVALNEGKRVLARAVAGQFRHDLLASGLGDGCYAFSLKTPLSLLDGEEHFIEVIEQGSGLRIAQAHVRWPRAPAGADAEPVAEPAPARGEPVRAAPPPPRRETQDWDLDERSRLIGDRLLNELRWRRN